jgi:hypothetical protein
VSFWRGSCSLCVVPYVSSVRSGLLGLLPACTCDFGTAGRSLGNSCQGLFRPHKFHLCGIHGIYFYVPSHAPTLRCLGDEARSPRLHSSETWQDYSKIEGLHSDFWSPGLNTGARLHRHLGWSHLRDSFGLVSPSIGLKARYTTCSATVLRVGTLYLPSVRVFILRRLFYFVAAISFYKRSSQYVIFTNLIKNL